MYRTGDKNSEMKKMIVGYVVGMFMAVWLGYYNLFAFSESRLSGGIASVIVYCLIYIHLAKLYKAFEVDVYQIGEIIFSQILAICIPNGFAYIECCLIAGSYISIFPGLFTTFLQIIGVTVWAVTAKRDFVQSVKESRTLIVYGRNDVDEFCGKLMKKYSYLFEIGECVSSGMEKTALYQTIDQYETVILYEVEYGTRTETMEYCIQKCKKIYITPRIADIVIQGFYSSTLVDTPLMRYGYKYDQPRTYHWKRALDLTVSAALFCLFAIPMLLTAAAIKIEDGGPVFFRQKRCTKNGRVFEILKFRSMIVDAEKNGAVIPCIDHDPRITKVGRIIRRYRIDEMPQIFNVLKGEMSIVGPRPERVEHVQEYTKEFPEFSYRLRVNGGLTGYAQIFGKYNTGAADKLKLDLMYIENQSLLLDLKLIMMTLKIMFIPESTEGFQEEKSRKIGRWEDSEMQKTGKKIV